MRIAATLALALLILSGAAWLRPAEYDEAYSIFLTAGDPRPAWPAGVFQAADVRAFYTGNPSLEKIARDLRKDDVHPPLYFWALKYWRGLAGPGWFAARLLSVLFATGALGCLAWLATLAEIPPVRAVLIALFSYGFAYTGIVARGFALAQLCNLLGMALLFSARRDPPILRSLAAGIAFGAAAFSNYLAVFIFLAALLWIGFAPRRGRILLPMLLGFAAFLPGLIYFFRAQHASRMGQFAPFSLPHASSLLAKDAAAALFGGLPLYAGRAGLPVTCALILFTALCAGLAVRNWRPNLALFALCAISVPTGLLALGLLFDNTPIEIRYIAFALPFAALILAATLPAIWACLLLAIEACGILGLIFAPATMQPQAIAARQLPSLGEPAALLLLPFGNDGVGVPGPFIAAAPDRQRIELIKPGLAPDLDREPAVILANLRADAASTRASAETLAALHANSCWARQHSTMVLQSFARICGDLLSQH